MTDRPRRWVLVDFGDEIRAAGPPVASPGRVPVIEWDRERVLPIVEAALARALRDESPSVADDAQAIFDALDDGDLA